jgi:hypothetical protein
MRRLTIPAMVLACGACQPVTEATVTADGPGVQPTAAAPACDSYTVPVTVGGQQQQAVVEACQQSDGSWRITQNTPGLPPQIYDVPAPTAPPYPFPAGYAYPDYFADWWGSPWYLGLAPSIFVVQRFNHFNNGFHRGFAQGMGRGFGHTFAAARVGGMGGGRR